MTQTDTDTPRLNEPEQTPLARVVVIDDHDVIVEALATRIARTSDMTLVGAAPTGEQGLALVAREHPTAVILDLGLPDMKGIDVCRQLRESYPDLAIVILTAYSDPKYALEAEMAGASAFITKETKGKDIMRIMEVAIAYPGSFWAENIAEIRRLNLLSETGTKLTDNELQLLRLVASGKNMMDAAEEVGVSDRTGRVNLSRAYAKLGANNATHAVYLAMRAGIIE